MDGSQQTLESQERREEPFHAAPCSPSSCVQCRHHGWYMTHLTATVRCKYPRERDPWVVDQAIFLHGNAVTPIKTAARCPHFEANEKSAGTDASAPRS